MEFISFIGEKKFFYLLYFFLLFFSCFSALKSQDQASDNSSDVSSQISDGSSVNIGSRGNWVKKREWLLKAKNTNKKIQDLADTIDGLRDPFWDKFKQIQEDLDGFYKDTSEILGKIALVDKYNKEVKEQEEKIQKVEQAALAKQKQLVAPKKSLFSRIFGFVFWGVGSIYKKIFTFFFSKKEVAEDPVLARRKMRKATAESKVVAKDQEDAEVDEKQAGLDDLKAGVAKVEEFDSGMVKRMEKLDQQIDMAVSESKNSRDILEEIWDIIDDKKAEASFYKIKTISDKLKSIQSYLNGNFASDFDATIDTLNKKKTEVLDKIETLKQKGFIAQPKSEVEPSGENQKTSDADVKVETKKMVEKKGEAPNWVWTFIKKIPVNTFNFVKKIFSKSWGAVKFVVGKVTGSIASVYKSIFHKKQLNTDVKKQRGGASSSPSNQHDTVTSNT